MAVPAGPRKIITITPVSSESVATVTIFCLRMAQVRDELRSAARIELVPCLLSDGSTIDFDSDVAVRSDLIRVIVRHQYSLGLATTLVEGYEAALRESMEQTDLIVRLDPNDDPRKILEVVEHLQCCVADAVFLPVAYSSEEQFRRRQLEVMADVSALFNALTPVDPEVMIRLYNQAFAVNYQAYRAYALAKIVPELRVGLKVFQRQNGEPARWGFDALALMLASMGNSLDVCFGGWALPWEQSRTPQQSNEQAMRVAAMLAVFAELGGAIKPSSSSPRRGFVGP